MTFLKADLLGLSDFAWQRLRTRLDGLTDEEYLWEPVPGCWSVRPTGHPPDDGAGVGAVGFRMDAAVLPPEPSPFTTAAWRIAHLVVVLQEERTATWVGVRPEPADGEPVVPGSAAAALDALDRAYAAWRRRLAATNEDALGQPLGPIAGPYAKDSRNAFVLHILDELIHHGAEVGVVRDLYHARRLEDPFVHACLRADRAAVEDLRTADPGVVGRTRTAHPDLLRQAASSERWDAVRLLAELGFDVDLPAGLPGASPLHYAAGAGAVEVVRFLVERGADQTATDPTYHLTPRGWAEHFGHDDVAAGLAKAGS